MALNTLKCNYLMPLPFIGLKLVTVSCLATPAVSTVSYAGVRAALFNDRYRLFSLFIDVIVNHHRPSSVCLSLRPSVAYVRLQTHFHDLTSDIGNFALK